MEVYIATSLDNAAQHNRVRDVLWDRYHIGLTYDWTKHGSVRDQGFERIAEVAMLERDGVQRADIVIVLLPGGKGTHAELGMALAFGHQVVIYGTKEDFEGPRTCAFYHDPRCHRLLAGHAALGDEHEAVMIAFFAQDILKRLQGRS